MDRESICKVIINLNLTSEAILLSMMTFFFLIKIYLTDFTFIYSLGKLTTVMGLSDIAVINTDDATLIVPRDRVEEIKTIVSMVKQKGRDDLL